MTLDQLLTIIEHSTAADWHSSTASTVGECGWGQEVARSQSRSDTYTKLCIYRPNIDISLTMETAEKAVFDEPWVHHFPDHQAALMVVLLRYRGAIVHQFGAVAVDGGRYLLLLPEVDENGVYYLAHDRLLIARLLFDLHGVGGVIQSLDAALARAKIEITTPTKHPSPAAIG